jgi:hypothetical protein
MVGLILGQKVSMELKQFGGSWALPFTQDLREALDIGNPDEEPELVLMLDEGKHGRFLAVFKK